VRRVGLTLALILAGLLAPSAQAAFPGNNGKIAFERCDNLGHGEAPCDIWTMNADGSNQVNLTNTTLTSEGSPQWTADGQKIVFGERDIHGNSAIYTMNADGSNVTTVTTRSMSCFGSPGWSPDSQKIVFTYACGPGNLLRINVINANGTGQQALTTGTDTTVDAQPRWSPNGAKIVFSRGTSPDEIWQMNADGTAQTQITTTPGGRTSVYPDWSPDQARIAFVSNQGTDLGDEDVFTMNADGTGVARLTSPSVEIQIQPVWSPDGAKVAFAQCDDFNDTNCFTVNSSIMVANSNGTGETRLTTGFADDTPAWQPVPINSYPRPKGATPVRASLTIAYKPCTAPNRQHGAPLDVLSCNPPQMTSDYLTVGTGDANGMLPRSEGDVRYDVVIDKPATPVDESDVKLSMDMSDVFTKALADYAGELRASVDMQATDKNNTPNPGGPGAATTQSFPLGFSAPCVPTDDTTVGSVCSASTTANALIPGLVKGGLRSLWQLGQVQVFDGGSDSDGDTLADNTLFADEGVFAP
jgi:Tol biopolymer transport system component